MRYLNSSHGIIVNTLQPNLDVKMFNEEWFIGRLPTDEPQYVRIPVSMRLEGPSPQWNDMDQYNAFPQAPVEQVSPEEEDTDDVEYLYEHIQASRDKLFLIQNAAEQKFARISIWCVSLSSCATQHLYGFASNSQWFFTPSTPTELPLRIDTVGGSPSGMNIPLPQTEYQNSGDVFSDSPRQAQPQQAHIILRQNRPHKL
jgi:hypothetical protein